MPRIEDRGIIYLEVRPKKNLERLMEKIDEFPIEYVRLLEAVAESARAVRLGRSTISYASHRRLVLVMDKALVALEKYNEG